MPKQAIILGAVGEIVPLDLIAQAIRAGLDRRETDIR
jgi:chemotaxis response regulator CheB